MRLTAVCALCAWLCAPAPACAQADPPPHARLEGSRADAFSIRGFGTYGLARTNRRDYGVVSSYAQKKPVFRSWSDDLDSVLGLQAEWRATRADTAVVQGLAHAGEGWSPRVSLAFWGHEFDGGLRMRLGRLPSPLYYDAAVIHVGFASLSARPALPIYTKTNAMQHIDGFDLSWNTRAGDAVLELQGFFGDGGYTHRVYPSDTSDLEASGRGLRGLALALRSGGLTLRLSRSSVPRFTVRSPEIRRLSAGLEQLAPALQAIPGRAAQAAALAAYRNPMDSHPVYWSAAFDWSRSDWRFIAEWTRFESRADMVGTGNAWQATLGRSFDRLTPFAFVSRQQISLKPLNAAAFAPVGVPQIDAGIAAARAGLEDFRQSSDISLSSAGAGLRYELSDTVALKLQVERLRSGYGLAAAPGVPAAPHPPPSTLLSVTVNFVF